LAVAYTALFLWIFVTLALYAMCRPPLATALAFVLGTMFLPSATSFDPPIFPAIGKQEVISIMALLASYIFAGRRMRRAKLGRGLEVLILVSMIGVVFSVFSNTDSLRAGPMVVPGTGPTDFLANAIEQALRWGVPFFLGRAMFTRTSDAKILFIVLAVAGFVYTFPMMVELQISPQLHRFLYGFHQHAFVQTKRGDGYRPMVFMAHGLHLSLFMVMCMASAATLWRLRQKILKFRVGPLAVYLGVMLIACKSTGSTVYGMFIAPMVALAPSNIQVRAATAIALVVFSYPVLRTYNLLPYDYVINLAVEYSSQRRANSLQARLDTEQAMMERIKQRPWFGWASAGRSANRDDVTGEMSTVYDGYWVIVLGKRGIVGYVTLFAMLLLPIYGAYRAMPRIKSRNDRLVLGSLCLMIVINVFDLIPNSTTEGYLTLLSGAVAGLVPGMQRKQAARSREKARGRHMGDGKSRLAGVLTSHRPH
jgi:O-antigen ligase